MLPKEHDKSDKPTCKPQKKWSKVEFSLGVISVWFGKKVEEFKKFGVDKGFCSCASQSSGHPFCLTMRKRLWRCNRLKSCRQSRLLDQSTKVYFQGIRYSHGDFNENFQAPDRDFTLNHIFLLDLAACEQRLGGQDIFGARVIGLGALRTWWTWILQKRHG